MRNEKMFSAILGAMKKMSEPGGGQKNDNENMWRAETDKAGNGFAIIRFLPAKDQDDLPFVKLFDHGFQGPASKWFIEKCPTTIGQPCPVCDANGPLWNSGRESDKEVVRKRKRRQSYVSNVLVVSDPKNPDNEGKVFMFKYGKKIFDKLMDAMQPPVDDKGNPIDPDEQPVNPFDPVEGANFKLKIRKVDGYANFDKSEFEDVSAVDNDEALDAVFDLKPFVEPSSFKTYEELEAKFNQVWNSRQAPASRPAPADDDMDDDIPFKDEPKAAAPKVRAPGKPAAKKEESSDDDDMDFFRKLAEDKDD